MKTPPLLFLSIISFPHSPRLGDVVTFRFISRSLTFLALLFSIRRPVFGSLPRLSKMSSLRSFYPTSPSPAREATSYDTFFFLWSNLIQVRPLDVLNIRPFPSFSKFTLVPAPFFLFLNPLQNRDPRRDGALTYRSTPPPPPDAVIQFPPFFL